MRVLFLASLLLTFLLSFCNSSSLTLNEIMPNPLNESNEWIEIYNPGGENINVSEWMVGDEHSNDTLVLNSTDIVNKSYFIIVGETANISKITNEDVTYFRTEGKIGNCLANSGDKITIYNATEPLTTSEYPSFDGKENISWARFENGTWVSCENPTPGLPNTCGSQESNQTNTSGNGGCDLTLTIECSQTFFMGKNEYKIVVEGKEYPDTEVWVKYWIEDLFGDVVREEVETRNLGSYKQWTPDEINGSEAYLIKAIMINATCNDTNASNNHAEKMIVVKGDAPHSEEECSCDPVIVEVQKECSCDSPRLPAKVETKNKYLEIISWPENIYAGEEIMTGVRFANPHDEDKVFSAYSYLYLKNTLISMGMRNGEWLNRWDANSQNFSVRPETSLVLEMKNKIRNDVSPGDYNLRVRVWVDGAKHDDTREVKVIRAEELMDEEEETPQESAEPRETEEAVNRSGAEKQSPTVTGMVTDEGEEDMFVKIITDIVNFFKNLLGL